MIPIRIRQIPAFVFDLVKRCNILRRPTNPERRFRLCFFSCHSHFRFLYCSLHSLSKYASNIPYSILIFSDEEQPLSEAQIVAIESLIPGTRVMIWPKSVGWGAKQIGNIWRAYGLAVSDLKENDILAKIDSDVFFFNDTIFRAVARSDASLVGDGHYVNFEYSQGGCYFLTVSAVRKINVEIEGIGMQAMLGDIPVQAEDAAVHYFAKKLKLPVWLTWYMMFPDELKNAGRLSPWIRWKFSCLHFVMKNKVAMLEAYEHEVFLGNSPSSYRKALTIQ